MRCTHLPKPHDPFVDLVPNAFGVAGIKLTPRHYAYLKISEGCNHRCTFCIIPSMRGDLVSRPIGDVLNEAQALFEGGVKELLVISQDTSAYGVDVKYRTGFWNGKPIKTRLQELVQALGDMAQALWCLGAAALCVSVPQCGRHFAADGHRACPAVSGCAVPTQPSGRAQTHEAPGQRRERIWNAFSAGAQMCPEIVIRSTFIAGFPGETEEEFEHLLELHAGSPDRSGRLFCLQPG
jgi:ribosomal protein S12 methylthiotransferase